MCYELSDQEWSIIRAMLPTKPRGIPRVDDRRVLNGIFWVLRSGAPWRDLPPIYGPRTTPWEIKAREFANCNCAYGCPCQFNALPTMGFCEAAVAMEIDEGHYGDVKLDGLRMGGIFQWPGAVHEGRGKCQPFIDERADAKQREALLKIMSGQDTAPMATMFAVYFSTLDKVYDPISPIDFEVDIDGRRGRYSVAGLIETRGEPIKNPVTGAETRARIDLPAGFEYEIAEVGSGSTKTQGNVVLDLKDSYGQFARLHLNNDGVVRHRTV